MEGHCRTNEESTIKHNNPRDESLSQSCRQRHKSIFKETMLHNVKLIVSFRFIDGVYPMLHFEEI